MRLNVNINTKLLASENGVTALPTPEHPSFFNMSRETLTFALYDSGNAASITSTDTFTLSLDVNFNDSDTLVAYADTCTVNTTDSTVAIPLTIAMSAANYTAKLGGDSKTRATAYLELKRTRQGETYAEVLLQDTVTLKPLVQTSGEADEVSDSDIYATLAQVNALVGAANVYQYHSGTAVPASDSAGWSDTLTSAARWYRERKDVTGSTWGAALPLGRSTVIIDTLEHEFSTTAGQAAELTITKTALGIASDAEPQLSLWSVGETGKTKASDTTYTAKWTSSALVITYYTTWPLGDWTLKLS